MSNEKLAFNLPVAFTIGPKDDIESLQLSSIWKNILQPHKLKACK